MEDEMKKEVEKIVAHALENQGPRIADCRWTPSEDDQKMHILRSASSLLNQSTHPTAADAPILNGYLDRLMLFLKTELRAVL